MGYLRRLLASIFGSTRDGNHETNDPHDDREDQEETRNRGPTRGFSGQVPVTVDRPPLHLGPVLSPCNLAQGGVQGLKWYAKRLRVDEDGDFADEFLCEVLPETSGEDDRRLVPKFEVKCGTRAVKVRDQRITDGNILQSVEYRGRLQWV